MAVGIICGVAALASTGSTAPAAASVSEAPVAVGVSISNPAAPAELQDYVTAVGRNPALVMWFQSFDEPLFYPNQLPVVAALGAVPMITWEPSHGGGGSIPLRDIAAGNYDNYLRQAAVAAAGWGKPLFVRFAHEMNLRDSSWGPGVDGNTAADYIAAWQHVVSIFRDAGATNVLWIWSPNVDCGGACPFTDFYPGDAWVDWVALDGYNYSSIDDVPWMSVSEIFGSSYDDLTRLTNKPVMIAETASTEVGGDKAAWITQGLLSDLPTRLPRVRAVVWFQRDKETDWRVNSSSAALDAFRSVADNQLYAGSATDLDSDTSNPQQPSPPPISEPQPSSGQSANGSIPQQGQEGAPVNGTAGSESAVSAPSPATGAGPAPASRSAGGVGAASAAMHSSGGIVKAGHSDKYGIMLVSSSGMTLYRYAPDKRGTSVCSGARAKFRPPLLVTGTAKPSVGSGAMASLLGTVKRADGTRQISYGGFPLYRFAEDKKPGDVKGFQGKWHVVSAKGTLVTHAVSARPKTSTAKKSGG